MAKKRHVTNRIPASTLKVERGGMPTAAPQTQRHARNCSLSPLVVSSGFLSSQALPMSSGRPSPGFGILRYLDAPGAPRICFIALNASAVQTSQSCSDKHGPDHPSSASQGSRESQGIRIAFIVVPVFRAGLVRMRIGWKRCGNLKASHAPGVRLARGRPSRSPAEVEVRRSDPAYLSYRTSRLSGASVFSGSMAMPNARAAADT